MYKSFLLNYFPNAQITRSSKNKTILIINNKRTYILPEYFLQLGNGLHQSVRACVLAQ